MTLARGLRVAAVLGTVALPRMAHAAPDTVYFPHADAEYLYPGQKNGGAALVPEHPADAALPLIVFLHGTNPDGDLHFWFGGGGRDLRPVAAQLYRSATVKPFIFAGPSQTRAARHGRKLWNQFNLDGFVEDVARALDGRAKIDRESVVFVGHSGAGCNFTGGLATDFWSRGSVRPLALVAVDPCLDAGTGAALSRRPSSVPLWLMWQAAVWPRDPGAFRHALAAQRPPGRVDRIEKVHVAGPDPHEAILPLALERAARELFAHRATSSGAS